MEMKLCNTCGETRSIDDFPWQTRNGKTRRRSGCKQCQARYKRAHYERNIDAYKARSGVDSAAHLAMCQERICLYLDDHPCVDCGETAIECLEFDHIDPRTKVSHVSELARKGYTWSKVLAEIVKCEVRCLNCHRKRTAKQRNWYRVTRQQQAV